MRARSFDQRSPADRRGGAGSGPGSDGRFLFLVYEAEDGYRPLCSRSHSTWSGRYPSS